MADDSGTNEDRSAGSTAVDTYANEEYGYRLAYPSDWLVETEPAGGVSIDDRAGSGGVTVSVDTDVTLTLADYVDGFLAALAADEHVRALEGLDRRTISFESGGTAKVVEYTYLDNNGDRWRLTYLFALDDMTGYALGVDWNDDDELDDRAMRIIESFAVETTTNTES